jgi:HK97 family phage portal protein
MGVFVQNEGRTMNEQQFIDYVNGVTIYGTSYGGMNALQNSDVYTGVNIIAGDIAQSPFKPVGETVLDKELMYKLNREPMRNQSHYMMMYAVVSNLILTGNAYVLIHRNKDMSLDSLEFVESSCVNVIQDMTTGTYRYDVTMPYGSVMYRCEPHDILHFRMSSFDGWLGRSPLLSLKEEVELQSNGLKVLNKFFSSGIFAGGILKLKDGSVNNATKRKIKTDFDTINQGGGTMVLDETQEYTANTINTEVLKLIQANKFSTQQIAKVLGIPVNRFGQELVNSSDAGQNDLYISSTIAMYEASICDELNLKLDIDVELDLKKLRQDTYEDRLRRIAEGKVKSELASALTVNDARDYLGFEHIEGGETLLGTEVNTKQETEVYVNENEELGNSEPQ